MRPIRNSDPVLYRIVSTRTCGAKLFMIPSRNMEKLIGGIVARYQEIFGIEVYAYFILSNHYHLLIKSPKGNTDEFIENLNREIALRVNRKLGMSGRYWERRYDDIPVGNSEGDLLRAFLYVTTNATRHGLLRNSRDWKGLNSFEHSLKERDREFTFYHYSAKDDEERSTRHKLKLTVLPDFKGLTYEERKSKIESLLIEKMENYAIERKEVNKGFIGQESVLTTVPGAVPLNISRTKRPVCYTKDLETLLIMRKAERLRRSRYKEASFEYRLGNLTFKFPEFTFKPPLHRAPRFEKFKPLSAADFCS